MSTDNHDVEGVAVPDAAYLAKVKQGQGGGWYRGRPHRQPYLVGCDEVWKAHYLEGLVTYPGACSRGFVPVDLTEKGEQALLKMEDQNHD